MERTGKGKMGWTLILTLGLGLALGGTPGMAQEADDGLEVPLRVIGGSLAVPVRAAGEVTLEFLLDPGTAVTVLAESTAARLGTEPGLSVAGVTIPTDGLRTLPDATLRRAGTQLAGTLGANTLRDFDVLVDAPGGRMVLKEVGPGVSWEGMTLSAPVRLQVLHGLVLTLEVELDGTPYPAMMSFDGPALVGSPAVGESLGVGKRGEAELRLGGVAFPETPVRIADLDVFRRFRPDGSGFVMLGSAPLVDCATSISWAHRELRTCVR